MDLHHVGSVNIIGEGKAENTLSKQGRKIDPSNEVSITLYQNVELLSILGISDRLLIF